MDKSKIERICGQAGMRAETREHYHDHDIFIADGLSMKPHAAYRKFGLSATDDPMYVTLWWVSRKEDQLDTGQPLFFKLDHNKEYDILTAKRARINRALLEARGFIDRRDRQRKTLNGYH